MKAAATSIEQPLASRLLWVTGLRLLFTTLLLFFFAFFYLEGRMNDHPFSTSWLVYVISATYALAFGYAVALRSGRHLLAIATLQIVADQLLATAVVYISGGASSGATSVYALTCLTGAILVGLRGAILSIVVGLGCYATLCGALAMKWIAPPPDQPSILYGTTASATVYPFLLSTFGILLVGALSGYLAERVRLTGGALAAAELRASRAERLAELGRISAWLAHEIRNPLGSIQGCVELLQDSTNLEEEERKLLGIVKRESARLDALVRDMLDFARPRTVEPTTFDLAALVSETVSLAGTEVTANNVRIERLVPAVPTPVHADESQVRQVIWNLLRNAVQASPEGGIVTAGVATKGSLVELTVSDCGPGIDPQDRPRLFDAFFTKKRAQGTGIGLSVVKQIIDDHAPYGVRISVLTDTTQGATFCVQFPAVREVT